MNQKRSRNIQKLLNNSISVPVVQITAVALAFWVALTRVKDHMHHPGDVIGGALIGTGIQVRRKSYKPYPSKHSLYPIFPP